MEALPVAGLVFRAVAVEVEVVVRAEATRVVLEALARAVTAAGTVEAGLPTFLTVALADALADDVAVAVQTLAARLVVTATAGVVAVPWMALRASTRGTAAMLSTDWTALVRVAVPDAATATPAIAATRATLTAALVA